jgi:hypothetical protein
LGEVLGVGSFDQVAQHVIEVETPSGLCRVLDLDTLIVAKTAVGRDHDLVTVRHLKEIKKEQQQE